MQWVPPYQGADYHCADCPLRNKTGPSWDACYTAIRDSAFYSK